MMSWLSALGFAKNKDAYDYPDWSYVVSMHQYAHDQRPGVVL